MAGTPGAGVSGNVNPIREEPPCSPPTSPPLSSPRPYAARAGCVVPDWLRPASWPVPCRSSSPSTSPGCSSPASSPSTGSTSSPVRDCCCSPCGSVAWCRSLRAGWSGRQPSSAAGLLHLAFMATGVATAAAAPGGGAPALVGIVVVSGALLWLASACSSTAPAAGQGRPAVDAARPGRRGGCDAVRPGPGRPPERRDRSPRSEPALLRHGLAGHHAGGGRDPRRGGPGGTSPGAGGRSGTGVDRCDGRCCSPSTDPGPSPCWCSACR